MSAQLRACDDSSMPLHHVLELTASEKDTFMALTGAVSHVSLGAQIFPLPMAVVVLSCLFGAWISARFANRCEIKRLNRIVGVVLVLLGIVTIAIKLL